MPVFWQRSINCWTARMRFWRIDASCIRRTNCSTIDAELDELLRETAVVTELTQRCTQEKHGPRCQEEYQRL